MTQNPRLVHVALRYYVSIQLMGFCHPHMLSKARKNLPPVYISQWCVFEFSVCQTTPVVHHFLSSKHREDTPHEDYTFSLEFSPPNPSRPFLSYCQQKEKPWGRSNGFHRTLDNCHFISLSACICVWKFLTTWKSQETNKKNVSYGTREQKVLWNFIRKGHPKGADFRNT